MAASLKDSVRAVLPRPLLEAIRRRRATMPMRPIDLAAVEPLRAAPLEHLKDSEYLEHELLPSLGLNDENPDQMPAHLRPHLGRGLRFWQYPAQFAPYLVFLSSLQPRSYLELGVRHGGTFVVTTEYLRRTGSLERSVAVDLGRPPSVERYVAQDPALTFLQVNSRSAEFVAFLAEHGPFDVVLVDGDHSPEGVRSDVETVLPHARAVVLHDTTSDAWPGPGEVLAELRERLAGGYDFASFTAQYDDVLQRTGRRWMGIDVLVRRSA